MRHAAAEFSYEPLMNLLDRYRGTLLGVAIGDCLGTPLEGQSPPAQSVTEIPTGSAGSDDLAMTLCMADAIVEAGNYDRDTVVGEYVKWLQAGAPGIGRSTYLSLSMLALGESADLASEQAHTATGGLSAGNGVAMRCSPIALRYRGNREAIQDIICVDGRVTHYDPLAALGATAVGLAIEGCFANPADVQQVIADAARDVDDRQVAATLQRAAEGDETTVHPTGYVLDTVHAAVMALVSTNDFESCLIRAVNYGGDADTVGAIAGSMAGAWYGAAAIPQRWIDALADRDRIVTVADELHELSIGP